MSVFDRLRGRWAVRRYYRVVNTAATYVGGKSPGELYREQPALHAVVSFIADSIGQLPLKVYIREGDNDRRRVIDGVAAVIARPNIGMTSYEMKTAIVTDVCLYGFALIDVVPDADRPEGWSLVIIPAAWVEDTRTVDGFTISEYLVNNPATDAPAQWMDASTIVRFCSYDPDGPVGASSPVEALKQVLTEQLSAWAFRNNVWRNGGWINAYLTRPATIPWSPEARDRFAKSWKERFSGKDGTDTGGTPILEDGMELRQTQFNAREAQWQEATRLAREDTAAVYHLNPSQIWHTEAQTYASAKDNARALYADTLAPILKMVEERFTGFVLPMMGVPGDWYAEFDLQAKLNGSFEEQASVIQSAVGRPWMTVDEARGRFNMPAIDGGDELTIPLNVLVGGLASPNDTDPTVERYNAGPVQVKAEKVKARGYPDSSDAREITEAIAKFERRQAKRVLQDIGKAGKSGFVFFKTDGDPSWWDSERWDRELGDDLFPIFLRQAVKRGRAAMRQLLGDDFSEERIEAYIRAMARGKAQAINKVTLKQLLEALGGDLSDESEGSTPEGVFKKAETDRADMEGVSFATAVAGWAVMEACRQHRAPAEKKVKTWIVTSSNPRASHALLNGETVRYDRPFSNGAMYPGDRDLEPAESCGCQCQVEVTIG